MPTYAGFLYTDAGAGINGATVNLYTRNSTTPVRATTTTNSAGYWTIVHGTEGLFDIEIVNGSSKRRRKIDDQLQVERIEASTLVLRGSNDAFNVLFAATPTAERTLTLPDRTGLVAVGNFAWCTVAADGTLQSNSYNIASVSRVSTGNYTVTISADFGDVNYSALVSCETGGTGRNAEIGANPTVGTTQVLTLDLAASLTDCAFHYLAVGSA